MEDKYKIIFLNPRAVGVFQDLAQDMAGRWSPSLMWTEVSEIVQFHTNENLVVEDVPRWVYYNS